MQASMHFVAILRGAELLFSPIGICGNQRLGPDPGFWNYHLSLNYRYEGLVKTCKSASVVSKLSD
jgi:hypothetical protein